MLTTFPSKNYSLAYNGGGLLYLLHFLAYLLNCSIHLGLRKSHRTPFPGVLWESLYTCNAVRAWRRLHFPVCLTARYLWVRQCGLNFPECIWRRSANNQ